MGSFQKMGRSTKANSVYFAIALLSYSAIDFAIGMSMMTAAGTPFALIAKLKLKPERRDEFLRVIQADAVQTLKTEPGSLQFVVGIDTEDTNTFHLHEQYKAKSDFDFHTKTPHFKMWDDFRNTSPFQEDMVVNFFHCDHKPVEIEQRAAFCLNVELCIKAEMREEFLEVIVNNQKGSRAEPLCLQYDFGEDRENPNRFYFHEQYVGQQEGKEGLEAHQRSSHFAKWEEFAAKGPFTQDPVVRFFRSIVAE